MKGYALDKNVGCVPESECTSELKNGTIKILKLNLFIFYLKIFVNYQDWNGQIKLFVKDNVIIHTIVLIIFLDAIAHKVDMFEMKMEIVLSLRIVQVSVD